MTNISIEAYQPSTRDDMMLVISKFYSTTIGPHNASFDMRKAENCEETNSTVTPSRPLPAGWILLWYGQVSK